MTQSRGSVRALAIVLFGTIAVGGALWFLGSGEADAPVARAAAPARAARADSSTLAAVPGEPQGLAGEHARALLDSLAPDARAAHLDAFAADAVYGLVADREDRAIRGAVLRLLPLRGSLESLASPPPTTQSDERGRFRFEQVGGAQGYRLGIEAQGYLPALVETLAGRAERIELARASRIGGRVSDRRSGVPLENVEVSLALEHWSEDGLASRLRALTDAEGRYALAWASLDGLQSLRVLAPGRLPQTFEFQVRAEQEGGYDIALEASRTVVLDLVGLESGAALADLEVELGPGLRAKSNAMGEILLDAPRKILRDREQQLDVRAPGWCTTEVRLAAEMDRGEERLLVPLSPGARLMGRVLDAQGRPVAGARVGTEDGDRENPPLALPAGVRIRNANDSALSGADGAFELSGLVSRQRPVLVVARHPDFVRTVQREVLLPAPGASLELELRLERGATLEGRVTLDGAPLAGRVELQSEDQHLRANSNDQGAYRLRGVAPGEVQLSVFLDRGPLWQALAPRESLVVEDGATLVHDLDIVTHTLPIAGSVRDSAGVPLAGLEVWASARLSDNEEFSASARTGRDGSFELGVEDSASLLWTISTGDGARFAKRTDVRAGTRGLELVLPEVGRIALEVVDAQSGEGVQRFGIYWRSAGTSAFQRLYGEDGLFSSGPDGRFVVELPAGVVDLVVSARAQGYAPIRVENVPAPSSGEPHRERVVLAQGVVLAVRFEPAEKGLPALSYLMRRQRLSIANEGELALGSAAGEWYRQEVLRAQSMRPGAGGTTSLRGLTPGTYRFVGVPSGLAFEPSAFEVPAVDRHELVVRYKLVPEPESE